MMRAYVMVGLLALLVGCKVEAPRATKTVVGDGLPVNHPPLDLGEVPVEGFVGRRPHRVSIDQLNASLVAVTDGIGWRDTINGQLNADMLEYLAPTLGRPDYAFITNENLDPNVLFAKFVSDGAQKVCLDVMARDEKRAQAKKVLARFASATDTTASNPNAVMKNVAYLRTRFLGDTSDRYALLAPYVKVFDDTLVAGGTPSQGWLAVCVSLLSDPLFTTY